MGEYTTILLKKSMRARLARRKLYPRESYNEALGRVLGGPSAPVRKPSPKDVRRAIALFESIRSSGPKRSFEETEALIKKIEKERDDEVLDVP